MQFQGEPFNGDTYLADEVLAIRDRLGLTWAIETGSCMGHTSRWLADHFDEFDGIERRRDFLQYATQRLEPNESRRLWLGDSVELLPGILSRPEAPLSPLIFLDAHWGASCPLKEELAAIAASGKRPVLVIHDFMVPGSDLGYDSFRGQPFDWPWIESNIEAIYDGAFEKSYNTRATGARRGVLFTWPT